MNLAYTTTAYGILHDSEFLDILQLNVALAEKASFSSSFVSWGK